MDEDVVTALRARGIQTTTALDCGMLQRPDEEHLVYAATNALVLFSFNVADFARLHDEWMSAGRTHAGIILSQQQRYSVGGQVLRLLRLVGARSAAGMRNQVEFLSNWS